jgi:hypothetical protein
LRRRPRASVAITSRGTDIGASLSLTYKGDVILHEDDATRAWFYPALAERVRPGRPDQQAAFAAHLDSPRRVVIELVPELRIGFDAASDRKSYYVTERGIVLVAPEMLGLAGWLDTR